MMKLLKVVAGTVAFTSCSAPTATPLHAAAVSSDLRITVLDWSLGKDPLCLYAGTRIPLRLDKGLRLLLEAFPQCSEETSAVNLPHLLSVNSSERLDEPPSQDFEQMKTRKKCNAFFDARTSGGGFRVITEDGVVIGCLTQRIDGVSELWQFDIRRIVQF